MVISKGNGWNSLETRGSWEKVGETEGGTGQVRGRVAVGVLECRAGGCFQTHHLFIFETMVLVELAYKSYLLVMLVQAEIDPLPNLAV